MCSYVFHACTVHTVVCPHWLYQMLKLWDNSTCSFEDTVMAFTMTVFSHSRLSESTVGVNTMSGTICLSMTYLTADSSAQENMPS